MASAVRVEGLRELNRALRTVSAGVRRDLRGQLRTAAEPARSEAQSLAFSQISNIGPVWGRMKIGVTTSAVYIAPATRRQGGSPRPNLGGLLLRQAMIPAADDKQQEIRERLDDWIGGLISSAGL